MNNILINHSSIIDYPIDYNKYTDLQNIKFIEIDLNENEYLIIPSNWIHWVITDPYTFALSFEVTKIDNIDNNNNDNIIFNKLKNNEYYKDKGIYKNFDYDLFINKTANRDFEVLFSESTDCSPVIKNNKIKYFKKCTLNGAREECKKRNLYMYIGAQDISDYIHEDLNDIQIFIDYKKNLSFDYYTTVWCTLNKGIQSGLHHDSYNKFLYVLKGKKKVLLLPPSYIDKFHFENYYSINKLSNRK